ncbi:MAG: DUF4352 domain-containing protein [Armatimonadota bacterium]
MLRYLVPAMLLCVLSVAVAAPTVVVNGKAAAVGVKTDGGKAYLDVVALMQLLGGKASYDAATGKIYVNSAAAGAGAPANAANWGTPQLPGDSGLLGQVYKLRTGNPFYFRLNSAEYIVSQLRVGKAAVIPEADEKLLVLHFSVQNPQNTEQLFRFDTLKFTAVDAMNVNHEGKGWVGDEQTKGDLNIRLKPAQRVEGYACIVVPAAGSIPKLMVMSPLANDGPVLRYDLRDQVTPLPAPLADPADATGATALETVPAELNTPYSLRNFDVTVEKTETVTTALNAAAPKNGETFFVVTMSCKNKTGNDAVLRFDTFASTLTDVDGQQLKSGRDLLAATANNSFNQRAAPGADARVRLYFIVPKDAKLKTLALKEANSRTYQYDVSQ